MPATEKEIYKSINDNLSVLKEKLKSDLSKREKREIEAKINFYENVKMQKKVKEAKIKKQEEEKK